jgi:phage terminase large subunit
VRIQLLSHQAEFIESKARHTGLVAGFGGGKSHAGVYKTITKKLMYPNIDVAYYLPTYPLIKLIAFVKFTEALQLIGIPYTLNKSDKEIHTKYGRIIMRSMDNPELIIGYEVGYSLIDEADVLPKSKMNEVFTKIIARNRKVLPNGDINQTDMVSTPEGFKFLYEFFITKASENKKIIKARTYDNPYLSLDYIDSLLESYSSKQIEAYLNGEFTNLASGTVYGDYDRDANHTDRIIEETDKVLFVGMDFNSTQMAAIFHIVEDGLPMALDEITKGYNTEEVCKLIKARYPNKKIIIYPDASGDSNKSSSSRTDHDIIKQHGFQLYTHKTNPLVKDRVNTMNMMFRKGYKINRHKCPSYAQAMEQQVFDVNGVPDKKSGFDHCSDAGGYYIFTYSKPRNRVFL